MVNDEIVRKILNDGQISTAINENSFKGVTYPKAFEQMLIEYLFDTIDILEASGNNILMEQAICIAECIKMKHDAEKRRREYRKEY